jgi:dTDP-4-dehydrorhamnose 3,5-epimerase
VIFEETPLPGVFLIGLERHEDSRGWFARTYCEREFAEHGLVAHFVQVNASSNGARHTLRGLHYQMPPASETKVVRCVRGALWDVVLDLRPDSPTFGRHFGAELSQMNGRMMYVPKQCAHGFLTLEPDTDLIYLVDAFYAPELERGVRWDDPRFAIRWPAAPAVVGTRDREQRDFDPTWHIAAPG